MKNARHEQILKLIDEYEVETQEELDIRQLRLRKVQTGDGRVRYCPDSGDDPNLAARYKRVLKESFVSVDVSFNLLVIHTVAGMAMAAAAALDSLDWPELLGSIAGDDTIIAVIRSTEDAPAVLKRIADLTEQ